MDAGRGCDTLLVLSKGHIITYTKSSPILQTLCKVVTVLMHFLFMASFMWMLVEGAALYLSCTRAMYNFGDMRMKYLVVGWGVPTVIVLVSLGAQFPNYGDGLGNK